MTKNLHKFEAKNKYINQSKANVYCEFEIIRQDYGSLSALVLKVHINNVQNEYNTSKWPVDRRKLPAKQVLHILKFAVIFVDLSKHTSKHHRLLMACS